MTTVYETKIVSVEWQQRSMVFAAQAAGKPPILIDGQTKEGPSPVEVLLHALATCAASDVVAILEKKRLPLEELKVEVRGDRREEYPRRYVGIVLVWTVKARGATEQAVRQAIDLSLEKYCSVSATLDPEMPVTYELVLQA